MPLSRANFVRAALKGSGYHACDPCGPVRARARAWGEGRARSEVQATDEVRAMEAQTTGAVRWTCMRRPNAMADLRAMGWERGREARGRSAGPQEETGWRGYRFHVSVMMIAKTIVLVVLSISIMQ